jgi:hypothetical protein
MWTPTSPWRQAPGIAGQNLSIGNSSQSTTTFGPTIQAVQLSAVGGNCHVAIAKNPTATSTDMLVKSTDPPLVIRIDPAEVVACIQNGTDTGTLNVVPMTR